MHHFLISVTTMKTLETYIQQVLGIQPEVIPLDKTLQNKLPLYIIAGYKVATIKLFDRTICLLIAGDENEFTPEQLSKQKEIAEQVLDILVVFVFNKIASYNMKRYIERKINFIVPQKQLFIPDLMMDFRKIAKLIVSKRKDLSPMAQLVLFYHLQKEDLNGKTTKHIAQIIGGSYLNMNRAINNLRSFELCDLLGGKEKVLLFDADKKVLWDKALPFLINPIQKTIHTDSILNQTFSGMNALAHYTMLNDERRGIYAIRKDEFQKLDIISDTNYGENIIEIWKYNPKLLAVNGFVDRLSLYLQFVGSKDERIEMELETLIGQVVW